VTDRPDKDTPCPTCDGTGVSRQGTGSTCTRCHGSGVDPYSTARVTEAVAARHPRASPKQ